MKSLFVFLVTILTISFKLSANVDIKTGKVPDRPTKQEISLINRTLVWCTNSIGRINRGQMDKRQIETAKEKYFSKRDSLDLKPHLMSYIPKGKKEMPAISLKQDQKMFEGKNYRGIIQLCDEKIMDAFNKHTKIKKPTNIAEVQIFREPFESRRRAMESEQKIGINLGFKGVTYGVSNAVFNILNRETTLEEYKRYLIKTDKFDNAWKVTGSYNDFVSAQIWNGDKFKYAIFLKDKKTHFVTGSTIPKSFYAIKEVREFNVIYSDGRKNKEEIIVFEKKKEI